MGRNNEIEDSNSLFRYHNSNHDNGEDWCLLRLSVTELHRLLYCSMLQHRLLNYILS